MAYTRAMSDDRTGNDAALSVAQLHILNHMPEGEIVRVRPFDSGTREAAGRLLINLRTALPRATRMHIAHVDAQLSRSFRQR